MPTFSAIALDRMLEPGAASTSAEAIPSTRSYYAKPPISKQEKGKETRPQMSPALYATPDAIPLPNSPSIRMGVEKYLGLIAERKFTGKTEIGRMDRQSRVSSIYEIRTWWQLPGIGNGVTLHETETCSQPCGARGVAAHASGAMRTDTRTATRLVPDCTWRRFCSSEERSVLVEISSRPVWTWVYLRWSRKGSDRRSRVWGQGHG
ncbi:unnamed protein product [Brassica rapa]|uniref:Uncharacterized protein n=1 Tax=Brassica campestris TaxID=3711 RepID=A0A3P5ZV32_BRACM|nr:unnamed protein product [Brassica rapa]VDC75788.1 unnamed protein product [Brassica rapa]